MSDRGEINLDLPELPTGSSAFTTPRARPFMYPGTRPVWSFCFTGAAALPIRGSKGELQVLVEDGGWRDLDGFLHEAGGTRLADLYAVLAVGSNACPARLADPDKYGAHERVAVPVLCGWIEDVVSVYTPRMASYGSVPATVAGRPGAASRLWVTCLSRAQLEQMDRSEGRGERYDLVEMPEATFRLDFELAVRSVSAYYERRGLRARETDGPILLDCFEVIGAGLPAMGQDEAQAYVRELVGAEGSLRERNRRIAEAASTEIDLPPGGDVIPGREPPSRTLTLAPEDL